MDLWLNANTVDPADRNGSIWQLHLGPLKIVMLAPACADVKFVQ